MEKKDRNTLSIINNQYMVVGCLTSNGKYFMNIQDEKTNQQYLKGVQNKETGGLGLGYGAQQYFSYVVLVSFIGGGNRSTRRNLPTSH